MKIITTNLLDSVSQGAKENCRFRLNYNFHENLDDSLHRMLNALEPNTYIRPHKHSDPAKEEIFILLRGKLIIFIFDNSGKITNQIELSQTSGNLGIEIPADTWHSLIVSEPNTIVFEVKKGPYTPLNNEDFADWAPHPDNLKAVGEFMKKLIHISN